MLERCGIVDIGGKIEHELRCKMASRSWRRQRNKVTFGPRERNMGLAEPWFWPH